MSCFIPPNSNTLYLVNKILTRKFERYEWSDIQFGGIIGDSLNTTQYMTAKRFLR